jgi:DNA end-binding protein Ku
MPKAVWTGSLNLGLVNIPVSLYAATEPKDIRFHLVDEAGRRVRYRRFVEVDSDAEGASPSSSTAAGAASASVDAGHVATPAMEPARPSPTDREEGEGPQEVEVAYRDLKRAYEVDHDRLVTLDPEEIERARPQPSHTIDLEHFVRLEDIDPIFFEKSYFLAPRYGTHAAKPYTLLLRAMQDTDRVGIGRFVLRTKPHLVAVRAAGEVLALETMYFADEVRNPQAIVSWLQGVEVQPREIKMAEQLISVLETEWDPSVYADEYREELLRIIAEKTPTEIANDTELATSSAVEDLMEALKASVEAARKRQPKSKSKAKPSSNVG